MRAYGIQRDRYRSLDGIRRNADLGASMLERFCRMEPGAARLLEGAQVKLLFSARSRRNILQVARSIADLEGSDPIRAAHIGEAVQYRVPKMTAPVV
jgi:magnesium chelatase family protein